jgi:hypothetical protein
MADMSKKEFDLLTDAVNEGIAALMADPGLEYLLNKPTDPESYNSKRLSLMVRVRRHIADALANRLRYASDKFDPSRFKAGITGAQLV